MGYSYRHSAAPDDVIFTRATLQGRPGDPDAILAEMERITRAREASQPIREKTGGSTFKNPPGMKAWELIDRAGCRGLVVGDAQVSTMHCNFLINRGAATAADLEVARRGGAAARSRGERRDARMGDQADRTSIPDQGLLPAQAGDPKVAARPDEGAASLPASEVERSAPTSVARCAGPPSGAKPSSPQAAARERLFE